MPGLPSLAITPTTSRSERISALQLISSSIAQQRQTLNRQIFSHPYFLAPSFALFAVIAKLNYRTPADLATLLILLCSVTIALFSLVSRFTHEYLENAEAVGSEDGYARYINDNEVVIAKWDERVIGAVVVRGTEVWAWTVELRYRGKGLGRDLLEKAVEVARERSTAESNIEWAEDHANSHRIPSFPVAFNKPFEKSEARARRLLKEVCSRKELT